MAPIHIGAVVALIVGVCVVIIYPSAGTRFSDLPVSLNDEEHVPAELGVGFCESGPDPKPTAEQQVYTSEENQVLQTFKRVAPSVAYITISLQGDSIRAIGSGFLWDRQGHVVTNCHVVKPTGFVAENVKVELHGMHQAYDAIVVGVHLQKDLAVLKIQAPCLPQQIDVGTLDDLQLGQQVLAIGHPHGLDIAVTTGFILAIGQDTTPLDNFGGLVLTGGIQTVGSKWLFCTQLSLLRVCVSEKSGDLRVILVRFVSTSKHCSGAQAWQFRRTVVGYAGTIDWSQCRIHGWRDC
jgi:S1-C subfamily serine protease